MEIRKTEISNPISFAQSDFSASLLKNISSTESGSFVASPFSVLSVLAMLYLGAKGQTAKELGDALGKGTSAIEVAEHFGALARQDEIFEAANKIYLNSEFSPKNSFLQTFTTNFGSDGIENVDFGNSEATAEQINDFVEGATHGRIKDLISPEFLDQSVVMVLVNAIYFLKTWQKEFDPKKTIPKSFFISEGNSVQLPQMQGEDKFGYFEDPQVQVLKMDYAGGDAFMFVVLPKDRFGLDSVLNSVNGGKLLWWSQQSSGDNNKRTVQVQFPKFKIESTFDKLDDILETLGLKTMFSPSLADFSGISAKKIFASKAIQKAFIQVDEKGTEAAAATAMQSTQMGTMEEPVVPKFIADHPFIYFISGADYDMLFSGVFRGN